MHAKPDLRVTLKQLANRRSLMAITVNPRILNAFTSNQRNHRPPHTGELSR